MILKKKWTKALKYIFCTVKGMAGYRISKFCNCNEYGCFKQAYTFDKPNIMQIE
jgi:hypothetical protein